MNATIAKTTWRRDMRQMRDQQGPVSDPPQLHALADSSLWINAKIIASYCPTGSEQTPSYIEAAAVRLGKAVVYPRVLGAGQMVFKTPVPRDTFEVGQYGIAEPPASAKTLDISTIDLFLIPLLACDQYGTRLGYGGGYYDRLLDAASGFRCGLGFDFQKVTTFPESSTMCECRDFSRNRDLRFSKTR